MMKRIDVAVGIIVRDGQVCVAKRQMGQHLAGLWEFPGGKFETGEDLNTALTRELFEELHIMVRRSYPLTTKHYDYPEKQVALHVAIVDRFDNEPEGREGQEIKWVPFEQLTSLAFPKANAEFIQLFLEKINSTA